MEDQYLRIQRLGLEREFPKDSNDRFSRPQMTYGGEYGGYNTQQITINDPNPARMMMPQMRTM
jgi:hypothetical protein